MTERQLKSLVVSRVLDEMLFSHITNADFVDKETGRAITITIISSLKERIISNVPRQGNHYLLASTEVKRDYEGTLV